MIFRIEKSANLLKKLMPSLKEAILSAPYIHFDETYHKVLGIGANNSSRKAYF